MTILLLKYYYYLYLGNDFALTGGYTASIATQNSFMISINLFSQKAFFFYISQQFIHSNTSDIAMYSNSRTLILKEFPMSTTGIFFFCRITCKNCNLRKMSPGYKLAEFIEDAGLVNC